MVTVNLGRTEKEFWRMTPKRTSVLIAEWSRMEELQGQAMASRIAYATVMMQNGKMPEWNSDKKKSSKTITDNDSGFMDM